MRLYRLALATLTLLFAASTLAADYYVDITNKTGYTIMYMYISPGKAKNWEEDVLGKNVLRNGATQRVNLNGYNSSIFYIRLEDQDGDSYTFWNVDVAAQDLVGTLEDLD